MIVPQVPMWVVVLFLLLWFVIAIAWPQGIAVIEHELVGPDLIAAEH